MAKPEVLMYLNVSGQETSSQREADKDVQDMR